MSRTALKLLLALSLAVTGCIAEAAPGETTSDESMSDLVMEPVFSEFDPVFVRVPTPTNPTECGQLQAELAPHCQPALQVAPNGTTFDPDQRPPEDPVR